MNNVHIKRTHYVLLTALLGITNAMTLVASQTQSSFCERQTQVTTLSGLPSKTTAASASATNTAATATLSAIAHTQSSSASTAVSTSSITTAPAGATRSESTMSEEEMKAFRAYCAQQNNIICQRASSKGKWSGKLGENQQEIAEKIYSAVTCLPKELAELTAQYSYEIRGKCTATIINENGLDFTDLISLPDGSFASQDTDHVVKIWSATIDSHGKENWVCTQTLNKSLFDLILLPNGFLASKGTDGVVDIWSPTNKKGQREWTSIQSFGGDESMPKTFVYLPDNSFAWTDHTGTIKIWSLVTAPNRQKTWTCIYEIHRDYVQTVSSFISLPDGSLVFGHLFGTIDIWSPTMGSQGEKIWTRSQRLNGPKPNQEISALISLPDGSLASQNLNCVVKILLLPNGSFASQDLNHVVKIWSSTTDDKGRKIWACSQELKGHDDEMKALISLCDNTLVSADRAGIIKIWYPITNPKGGKRLTCTQTFNVQDLHIPSKKSFIMAVAAAANKAFKNIFSLFTATNRNYNLGALIALTDSSFATIDGDIIKIWR